MATAKIMTLKRRQALEAAFNALLAATEAGQEPSQICAMLERDHGASFKNAWNGAVLSCRGVRSTCTGGLAGVLGNWRKAALLRLIAES